MNKNFFRFSAGFVAIVIACLLVLFSVGFYESEIAERNLELKSKSAGGGATQKSEVSR